MRKKLGRASVMGLKSPCPATECNCESRFCSLSRSATVTILRFEKAAKSPAPEMSPLSIRSFNANRNAHGLRSGRRRFFLPPTWTPVSVRSFDGQAVRQIRAGKFSRGEHSTANMHCRDQAGWTNPRWSAACRRISPSLCSLVSLPKNGCISSGPLLL